MSPVLRWLGLVAMLVTSSLGHRSSIVFDTASTVGYVDAICGVTNTTCRDAAEQCYYQMKKSRSFLEDMSLRSVTLLDRCNMMRDRFDTCADQANLNATWATITGSDRSCEGSFLRGGPHRAGSGRHERAVPWSSYFVPDWRFEDKRVDGLNSQSRWGRRRRGRSPRRFGGHGRRGGSRPGSIGQHRFDDSQSTGRVGAFINRIQDSNPDAMQNYTRCMLQQEGLLYANDTVARDQFETWATVAFATQPAVADAVKTAVADCPEPVHDQLADYMQCWGQACVETI